jgi:hypothetical protein
MRGGWCFRDLNLASDDSGSATGRGNAFQEENHGKNGRHGTHGWGAYRSNPFRRFRVFRGSNSRGTTTDQKDKTDGHRREACGAVIHVILPIRSFYADVFVADSAANRESSLRNAFQDFDVF